MLYKVCISNIHTLKVSNNSKFAYKMATSISCIQNPCKLPVGCVMTLPTKCIYYSGTSIPFMNIYPGNSLDTIINNISQYVGNITGIPVIVDTYADMITEATGTSYKRFFVLNDEDKGLEYTVYDYWPNTAIMWIAANLEINL